jgi:hypothetical protein
MTDDKRPRLSLHTLGADGPEFNGINVGLLEDAAIVILFELSILRAFVELDAETASRLDNACTWLRENTDGQRLHPDENGHPDGSKLEIIGRLR